MQTEQVIEKLLYVVDQMDDDDRKQFQYLKDGFDAFGDLDAGGEQDLRDLAQKYCR